LLAFGSFAVTVACTAPVPGPKRSLDPLVRCVPNQVLSCRCGPFDEGTQTCLEGNRTTKCQCADGGAGDDGGADDDDGVLTPTPSPGGAPGPRCGDGKVDPGEPCDDGNDRSGDGCSASCVPDGSPTSAESCPGQSVRLWKGAKVMLTGTTDGYTNGLQTSCYASKGPDRVYAIRPSESGLMAIDAAFGDDFNAVIEVREERCDVASAEVFCKDSLSNAFKQVVPVTKDRTYYLIVDGDLPTSKGAYSISVDLP